MKEVRPFCFSQTRTIDFMYNATGLVHKVRAQIKRFRGIMLEAENDPSSISISSFYVLQAIAGMSLGKGVKQGAIPAEVYKALPFRAKIKFRALFENYANN